MLVVGAGIGYLVSATKVAKTETTTIIGPTTITSMSTQTLTSVSERNLTTTLTENSTTTLTETLVIPASGANTTLRFVGASVVGSGSYGVVVNATYMNESPSTVVAEIVATAFPATAEYFQVVGGKPSGPVCCQIVRSYSTNGSVSASAEMNAHPGGVASSDLFFPALNGSIYWVKVVATALDGTVLSPVAYLLLETPTTQGNTSGGACGGQEAPGPMFYDQDNGEIYVVDSGTDSISVINGTNGRLVATISLPELVGGIGFQLYDPGNRDLYIESQFANQVFVIDTSTNLLVGEMTVSQPGQSLSEMVYDPLNGKIFGINFVYSLISVIDGSTNRIVANITGIFAPGFAAFDPANNELYVQAYNQTVFAINGDTYQVVARISLNATANYSGFIYDQDNGLLYTVSGDSVLMINSTTNRLSNSTITLPSGTDTYNPVLYNPSNRELYVYGFEPWFDALSSSGNTTNPDRLLSIDTTNDSVIASIPVQGLGEDLGTETPFFSYDALNGNIYATTVFNSSTGAAALIEISRTNAVLSQVTLAGVSFGSYIALDSSSQMLFVSGPQFGGTSSSIVVMVDSSSGSQAAAVTLGTCSYVTPMP